MSGADAYVSVGADARMRADYASAIKAYTAALAEDENHLAARSGLARVYIALEEWAQAEMEARAVLTRDASHIEARYTLASALLEQGDAEAGEALLSKLIAEGKRASAIRFVRGRCYLELGRTDEAIADLRAAHTESPTEMTFRALAGVLWMLEDREAFAHLLSDAPTALGAIAADILRQTGDLTAAIAYLDQVPLPGRNTAEALVVRANILKEQGEGGAARAAADQALQVDPQSILARDTLISTALMEGDGATALAVARQLRSVFPNDQHWIAHEATALRVLGDPAYRDLVRLDDHVRAYELPVPEGFASVEAFNAAFLEALARYRPYRTHPLDQSLRGGVQTPRDLTAIDEPVFRAYARALDGPIQTYLKDIGRAENHPLTARNNGTYKIAGCWSVTLGPGGRHVNHVHPAGWVSSAYYVSVPEEDQTERDHAGWIKFGEPPFACNPALPPEKWIQPRPGLLVLFPSFLWHGVEPIGDGAERVTAPFDLVPA